MTYRGLKARVMEFTAADHDDAYYGFDKPTVTYKVYSEGKLVTKWLSAERVEPAGQDSAQPRLG